MSRPYKYPSVAERIIANSAISDTEFYNGTPCWNWTGNRDRGGYGTMSFRYLSGKRKGQRYTMRAHRAAVHHMTKLRVTPKLVILHLCNNRACVNPAHLLGGTQRKNVKQCIADGRHKTPFRDPEMRVAL